MLHFWRPAFRCFIQPSFTTTNRNTTAPMEKQPPPTGLPISVSDCQAYIPMTSLLLQRRFNPRDFFFGKATTSLVNKGSNKENKIECSILIYMVQARGSPPTPPQWSWCPPPAPPCGRGGDLFSYLTLR